ncbi:MAG TPA: sugar ABC transporter permease [Patescibacteria group bacterium]|nr:sugar ABC transporter permease [Patescibacteria group bacterium]
MTASTAESVTKSTTLRQRRVQEALAGYAFIAVPMAIFLVFNIGAIVFALVISVFDWGVRAGPREFLGLENYSRALGDDIFWRAVANTMRYAVIVVPLQMAIGLFLAVIVNQKIRGQTFFRAAFYFPAVASSAAITVLFLFIMSPDGLFNGFRQAIGPLDVFGLLGIAENHSWVGRSISALESLMVLNAWTTSGTMMLLYLASLQTISRETYEAAELDGANAWQTFWRITFPLLRPGHYFVATVSFIGALQVFDQAYIAGGPEGTPNNSLTTMVLFLVRNIQTTIDMGFAAAVGMILFVLIMAVTLIQRRLFGAAPSWY